VELGQIDVLGDIGYKVQGDRCLEYKLGGPVSWVAVAETLESVR
jgi:hypothetical protein